MFERLKTTLFNYSHHRFAVPILFIFSVIEAIFFPIPVEILLIPMILSYQEKTIRFIMIAAIGSITGAMIAYWIGLYAFDAIIELYGGKGTATIKLTLFYNEYGFWFTLFAALMPAIPFKLATLMSGALQMNFIAFIVSCGLGRIIRYFIAGYWAKHFVEEKPNPWVNLILHGTTVIFVIVTIYAFIVYQNIEIPSDYQP